MDQLKKGLLLTGGLSFILIIFYFGEILKNPNELYFAEKGDGFKSYYGAIYHLNYDSAYFKFEGMNYPYGESVFFTDNQTLLTNTVKWISKNLIDIRNNMVGIINLSMILSIPIAAICLFFLFTEMGVTWWFSSLAAIGICMLSPQIGRMGGHFSLSHLFWIPLMLYLILRFSKKQKWKFTFLIALVGFLAASMHLYFSAFYALLLTLYWLFSKNWIKEGWKQRSLASLHWVIQTCLPIILVQLIMLLTDPVSDRTTHPYGFLVYLAHPVSIFLPGGAPYHFIPKVITVFQHLEWEAFAFIGVTALIGFLTGMTSLFIKMFRGKAFWKVSDKQTLTIFFWASMVALLLSFGIPFIFDMKWLVDYIGPIRQLRALSRFSWLFFYVINVVVFYGLFKWFSIQKNRPFAIIIVPLAFVFLFTDGYYNMRNTIPHLANRNPLLEDKNNLLPENQWINKIDINNFQCILPIPYFHVGSENIWIDNRHDALETTLIGSLKTGLPTMAVMMGRTSISQTYKNYSLMMEPLHEFEALNDFKNEKDILLLRIKSYHPNTDEQRLLDAAKPLTENDKFELLSLPFEYLTRIPKGYRKQVLSGFDPEILIQKDGLLMADTTSFYCYYHFDDEPHAKSFFGTGSRALKAIEWNVLLDQKLVGAKKGETLLSSFWLKDFRKDAYPRFNIEIIQQDDNGQTLNYFYSDIHPHIKAIEGDWALFEIPFTIEKDNVLLKLSIRNTILRHVDYLIDELLVRKITNDIFQIEDGLLIKNTRQFNAI